MWEAVLDDGTVTREETHRWKDVKSRVVALRFIYHGVTHSLPEHQSEYRQAKSASALLTGGEIKIESRWISCKLADGSVRRLRFSENKNLVTVETE